MCTSKCGSIPFINVSTRYLDELFNLHTVSLATEMFARPHTGKRIADKVEDLLTSSQLGDKNLVFITDHGPNVMCSSDKYEKVIQHIGCLGHSIHTIFTKDVVKMDEFKEVAGVLQKIRRTHGALVYKLHVTKETFETDQLDRLKNYFTELEEVFKEMLQSEGAVPFSDADEYEKIMSDEFKAFMDDENTYRGFMMTVPTRWFYDRRMVESFLHNKCEYIIFLLIITDETLN